MTTDGADRGSEVPGTVSSPASARSSSEAQPRVFAAVDIGASSGRVVAGWLTEDGLQLELVHRYPNAATESDGHLRWNLTVLFEQVLVGLGKLADRHPHVQSIGIDTWAVDYGLLDDAGRLLAEPVSYRDGRTGPVVDDVHTRIDQTRLYSVSGLQFLPFNTIYQLAAEQRGSLWARARHAVMLPDLLAYWLTGQLRAEVTNASTTGLFDARTGSWSTELMGMLDIPADLFPPLVQPGQTVGALRPEIATRTGLSPTTTVVAVGSHDTASAVVGVPATEPDFAYVSSGTWSLVGLELDGPVLTEGSRLANFTNEAGVDGRVRYLRNVGGLWLLQESLRSWREAGHSVDQDALLAEAADGDPGGPVIDVNAAEFVAPGDMPKRIRDACARDEVRPPVTPAAVVRCILDSLAVAYARTIADAERLSGRRAAIVHIVGGGCQNELLCQLTADLSGLPVLAGPVEATAIGNIAVQARAAGVLPTKLEEIRAALRPSFALRSYTPHTGIGAGSRTHPPSFGDETIVSP